MIRQTERIIGWLPGSIKTSLTCPRGHRIHDGWLITASQCVRCRHRASPSAPPCDALLWVITTHVGATFVASVTHEDVAAIKEHATIQDTLAYLGAPIWRAA